MTHRARRAARPAVVAFVVAGLSAASAPARPTARWFAAPEILIVHGAPLAEPRVIADYEENQRLLRSAPAAGATSPLGSRVPPAALAGRPALRLALFWGAGWRATARSPERLRALRPEQANQRGLFYPATADEPARLEIGAIAGAVSDSGLAVLRRHGVPVRLPIH